MANRMMYGISFIPEIINNNMVMLRPSHIIDGIASENKLYDRYDESYKLIKFTVESEEYKKMYGLGVFQEELIEYAKKNTERAISSPDLYARTYLSCIKQYVFFLEKTNHEVVCNAMDLKSKKMFPVDLRKSAITQLSNTFPNIDKEQKDVLEKTDETLTNKDKFISPQTLYENVTKRVIGQDEAAFKLCTTICNNAKYGHYENMKDNILIYGPSGCGKTELIRTLAKELNIPLVIEDMTSYTASGYVGDSVKKILRRLVNSCNGDISKAEKGIIVLDEIDKLASTDSRSSVNKTDVQEELLKIIEGGDFDFSENDKTNRELIINTSNITFILCGAFTGFLEKSEKRYIGFGSETKKEEQLKVMTNEDLIKYGLMPELVGRIAIKIPIQKLKEKELSELLIKSNISCLKIYETALLEEDNVRVVYNDKNKFISTIANKAEKLGVGARGLKTIVDNIFMYASAEINKEQPTDRELFIFDETIDNPKVYELKKVKRGNEYELSKRTGENNN